jgi:hypothetical protein
VDSDIDSKLQIITRPCTNFLHQQGIFCDKLECVSLRGKIMTMSKLAFISFLLFGAFSLQAQSIDRPAQGIWRGEIMHIGGHSR